jgi:hypothetical protein
MTSTANFPTPQWILVTRGGPQAFTTYNTSMANSSPLNAGYVTGRYAYTIYDTSGLLDANVAGYPSTAAATSIAGKGLMPWADLTQLNSAIVQANVDTLVSWRNAASSSTYASYVTTAATNNGFTRVANGDTTFLSRQELIKYAQTQNPNLTNALPYLTTFSRELNGPTWGPTTNATASGTYAYAASQYTSGSLNPRIPNPRVQATFTRNNGITAAVGEPLVKYRFPLDKLALLESVGTTYSYTDYTSDTNKIKTQIQQYFGLTLASDCSALTKIQLPSYRHWIYADRNAVGSPGIMTLDQVAQQSREPDFFELLQAGILSGSLGVPGSTTTGGIVYPSKGRNDKYPIVTGYGPQPAASPGGYLDSDDSATLETLRIGANIIDQWDADSFPTTITYAPPGAAAGSYTTAGSFNVQGIEDLPYPYAAYFNIYALNSGTYEYGTTPLPPFNFYLYFALWNPHQTPSSPVSANYPAAFRFYPYYNSAQNFQPQLTCCDSFVAGVKSAGVNGTAESWFYNDGEPSGTINGSLNNHYYVLMSSYATNSAGVTAGMPFSYSPSASANNYREPILAVPPGGVGTIGAVGAPAASVPHPFDTNVCLVLPPLNFPAAGSGSKANQNGSAINFPTTTSGPTLTAQWFVQNDIRMVMPVQYQDAAGGWHTYSTFIGMDDQYGAYANGTYYEPYSLGSTLANTSPVLSNLVYYKSDPRTYRFGLGQGSASPDVNLPAANTSGNVAGSTMPPLTSAPFLSTLPYRFDLLADNDGATPSANSYADTDGIQRWGDARNSYQPTTPTSPLFAGAAANRPVILNRPFQSVGELGYVYRDMPWKTLDLFSPSSADSALLDLFTLNDAPILAGRVNPNTPYPQVFAALISGATQSTVNNTTVSSANALSVGQAIQSTTTVSPFVTRADLVNGFMTNSAITTMSPIKTEEEAAVRSIAESSNTRTWNFMIDVIAQSGQYPASATGMDNFVVEGERRYWLHVAIDRYTGQVVDRQLEVVNE